MSWIKISLTLAHLNLKFLASCFTYQICSFVAYFQQKLSNVFISDLIPFVCSESWRARVLAGTQKKFPFNCEYCLIKWKLKYCSLWVAVDNCVSEVAQYEFNLHHKGANVGIVASQHLISRSNGEWPTKWNGMRKWMAVEWRLEWNSKWICTNAFS